MLAKAILPRVWSGLASRHLSLSCQTNRLKKSDDSFKIEEDSSKVKDSSKIKEDRSKVKDSSKIKKESSKIKDSSKVKKDSSKIKKDSSKIKETIAMKPDDNPKDESWKWNSNYFINHWNRETFGPQLTKKESQNLFKQKKAQNTEVFWVEKMKQFDMQNVDTIDVDQRKVLLHTIASAAASLPPPDKKVLRMEPSDGVDPKIASIASAAASLPPPDESILRMEWSDEKCKLEPFEIFEFGKIVKEDSKIENDEFSSIKYPLVNPVGKSDQDPFAGDTIQHTRDLQAKDSVVSVSKVLKATMPIERKLALQRWEENMIKEMGREKFNELQEMTLLRGERLHSAIESYFEEGLLKISSSWDDVSKRHLESLEPIINNFERPAMAIESQVLHPHLDYKGYVDCVTQYNDGKERSLVLIDWKTSKKAKSSLGATFDAPIQIAAYVGALNHDPRYPVLINKALAVIVYNDGRPADVLNITPKRLEQFWSLWLQRLKLYRSQKESEIGQMARYVEV